MVFRYYLLFVLLMPIFFSCSNSNTAESASFDEETLKQLSIKKDDNVLWTRELEGVRLIRNIYNLPSVDSSISLSPKVIALANVQRKSVYPEIAGFSSLDTSLITTELLSLLKDFCTSVLRWELKDDYMAENSLYSILLFKYDIENGWNENFGKTFPNVKNEDGSYNMDLFDSWIFGCPTINSDSIRLPVRFVSELGFIDVAVFVLTSSQNKIAGIELCRWEKSYGK